MHAALAAIWSYSVCCGAQQKVQFGNNSPLGRVTRVPHLQHVSAPGQQRQRINVGVHGVLAVRAQLVWSSMVCVVLLLPPVHAEALHVQEC